MATPRPTAITTLDEILCCPRCASDLALSDRTVACTNTECAYAAHGFPVTRGQPVLIDFERSIFDRSAYEKDSDGSVLIRHVGARVSESVYRLTKGGNSTAVSKAQEMIARAKALSPAPTILVVGGGAIGSGAEGLYADPSVTVVGTDVYASANTSVLADGHQLPFKDAIFDGVWIQAVLEHVLEPQVVVEEIYRVLKPHGLVYADTPFMQQVHEGAYDFTRFTQSGHRWLFRRFEEIDSGVVAGAGVATIWSIRYFARSLGAGYRAANLIALPFFWLRLLERFAKRRINSDAASATYFFGTKSNTSLSRKDIVQYYENRCR